MDELFSKKERMPVMYKVIVIRVDTYRSKIIKEKHFDTLEKAKHFQMEILLNNDELICVIHHI